MEPYHLRMIELWIYPLAAAVVIVIALTRTKLPGRPWLIAHLIITVLAPRLIHMIIITDIPILWIYENLDYIDIFLKFIANVGFCFLIPFVFAVAKPWDVHVTQGAGAASSQGEVAAVDSTNPYYGVHGWLKFFVVVNMYISPVLFGIQQIFGLIGMGMLADQYPGLVVVCLIELPIGLFFVIKWIMISRRLRDIVPGAVQEAKRWLLISLGWGLLNSLMLFMAAMGIEEMMLEAVKGVFISLIGFAIWYSYFNVSKRVKATYPDWNG